MQRHTAWQSSFVKYGLTRLYWAGATRLYFETNLIIAPAISLYESLGFRHLPPQRVVPSPYARADVFMELELSPVPVQ